MTKRRDLVRELEEAGFTSAGGTNHEKFEGPNGRVTFVPRHQEIEEPMAAAIRKQAGLNGKGGHR